jgi:cytochrome P450
LLAAPPDIQKELIALQADRAPQANTLLTADPPVHSRYRSQVSGLFTAGRVKKMQPFVDQIIAEAIDGFIDEDLPIDFAQCFAFPVPLRIIADRLGVPVEDRKFFDEAATAMASLLRMKTPQPDEMLRRAKQNKEFEEYMIALVEKRRSDPKEDLCSALGAARLEDEDRAFNPGEIWSILSQFLVAGHETTSSTFGFAMELLCKNPKVQDQIRGDEKLIRNFVEEALRLEAPVQGLPRLVTRDTELFGVPLKKGETLMLRYGAGNRDERQFPNPDEIDLDRKHPGAHLSFGSGTHHCPGAPLSRQELNRGILAILDRMENFRLSTAHPAPKPEPSLILRNLPELWIEFDRRQ